MKVFLQPLNHMLTRHILTFEGRDGKLIIDLFHFGFVLKYRKKGTLILGKYSYLDIANRNMLQELLIFDLYILLYDVYYLN